MSTVSGKFSYYLIRISFHVACTHFLILAKIKIWDLFSLLKLKKKIVKFHKALFSFILEGHSIFSHWRFLTREWNNICGNCPWRSASATEWKILNILPGLLLSLQSLNHLSLKRSSRSQSPIINLANQVQSLNRVPCYQERQKMTNSKLNILAYLYFQEYHRITEL